VRDRRQHHQASDPPTLQPPQPPKVKGIFLFPFPSIPTANLHPLHRHHPTHGGVVGGETGGWDTGRRAAATHQTTRGQGVTTERDAAGELKDAGTLGASQGATAAPTAVAGGASGRAERSYGGEVRGRRWLAVWGRACSNDSLARRGRAPPPRPRSTDRHKPLSRWLCFAFVAARVYTVQIGRQVWRSERKR